MTHETISAPATSIDPTYLQYMDLLEKTNQQLGMWTNPYAVMVACLSVLLTMLAIGVTFALFKHSKEQKDLFESVIKQQQTDWSNFFNAVQSKKHTLEKMIQKVKDETKKQAKGSDELKDLHERLKSLEKARDDLDAPIRFNVDSGFTPSYKWDWSKDVSLGYSKETTTSWPSYQSCSLCNRLYQYSKEDNSYLMTPTVHPDKDGVLQCPYCGHREKPIFSV